MFSENVNINGKEFVFYSKTEPTSFEFKKISDVEGLSEYELYLDLNGNEYIFYQVECPYGGNSFLLDSDCETR